MSRGGVLLALAGAGGLLALNAARNRDAAAKRAARERDIANPPPAPTTPAHKPPIFRSVPTVASRYPKGFPIPSSTVVIKKPFGSLAEAEAVLRGLGMLPVPLTSGRDPLSDNWARDMAARAASERQHAAANAMIVQAENLPQIAFVADLGATVMWVMPL